MDTITQIDNANVPLIEYCYLAIITISDNRDLYQAFKHLDPAYDGTTLHIQEEYEDQVAEICKVLQLNMDNWPGYNKEYSIMDHEQFKQHCKSIYADTQNNACIPAIKQEFDTSSDILNVAVKNQASDSRIKPIGSILTEISFAKKISDNFTVYKATGKPVLTGIRTGYQKLDYFLEGLQPGQLIVLAARASMGKTWVALNITNKIALPDQINDSVTNTIVEPKKNVAFISLEMNVKQLTYRLLALRTGINPSNIKTGELAEEEFNIVVPELAQICSSKLFITDKSKNGILDTLIQNIEYAHATYKPELIIIDHLHLVKSKLDTQNRNFDIGEITRQLKLTAQELNIPIILISQLNRAPDGRTDKRPVLSDLRDSGAIEQDADVVIFIYRDAKYNSDIEKENRNKIEINIAKNRDGKEGIIHFRHDPVSWKLTEDDEPSPATSTKQMPKKNEKPFQKKPKEPTYLDELDNEE